MELTDDEKLSKKINNQLNACFEETYIEERKREGFLTSLFFKFSDTQIHRNSVKKYIETLITISSTSSEDYKKRITIYKNLLDILGEYKFDIIYISFYAKNKIFKLVFQTSELIQDSQIVVDFIECNDIESL
jgi:hypothetical protein